MKPVYKPVKLKKMYIQLHKIDQSSKKNFVRENFKKMTISRDYIQYDIEQEKK